MGLFAIASGEPFGDEEAMGCCGLFIVLPSVVLISALSAKRESFWYAGVALALSGSLLALILVVIAGYQPSDDGDVMSVQAAGRRLAWWYAGTVAIAVLAMLWVAGRRLGWLPALERIDPPPAGGITPAPSAPDERIKPVPTPEDRLRPPPRG
jgi:hypothetical protein